MKKKTLSEIKNSKPFEFNDIFVYLSVTCAVLILLFVFVFFPSAKKHEGFNVLMGNKTVLSYYLDKKEVELSPEYQDKILVEETEEKTTVTIYTNEDNSAFNVIVFNKTDGTAKMLDANCGGKDCVSFPPLQNSGVIYCDPHFVKILPIGASGFIPPVTG